MSFEEHAVNTSGVIFSKNHKYGNSEDARNKYLLRSAELCSQFSQELSKHFNFRYQVLASKSDGTYKPLFTTDEGDEARQLANVGSRTSRGGSSANSSCKYCGSSSRKFFKLKPKSKTSKTVIRLLRKRNINNTPTDRGSIFKQRLLADYFQNTNRLRYRCSMCQMVTGVKGEKRSDSTFIDRHATRLKKRRNSRKLLRLQTETAINSSSVMENEIKLDSSININLEMTTPGRCDTPKSEISGTSFSSSFSASTKSPMQSYRTSTNIAGSNTKPVVQHRVASNNSATIIRKFKQQHVDKLMTAKHIKNSKPANKASALENFLKSMK